MASAPSDGFDSSQVSLQLVEVLHRHGFRSVELIGSGMAAPEEIDVWSGELGLESGWRSSLLEIWRLCCQANVSGSLARARISGLNELLGLGLQKYQCTFSPGYKHAR